MVSHLLFRRRCNHDDRLLTEIDEVISELRNFIPPKIQNNWHARKKYACGCGQCIRTVPLPAQPIPKSLASPGPLAHIMVSRYQDALVPADLISASRII